MPFLHYQSAFMKEQIWIKVYLEATCETYISETHLQVPDSARQGAQPAPRGVNVQEQNTISCDIGYLPAVPVG